MTAISPYQTEGLNKVYNLLFCDDLSLYKLDNKPSIYPWDVLLAHPPDLPALKAVAVDDGLEARQRLLACRLLEANGEYATNKQLLGVVIEVGLEHGLDVLAAFKDGRARYINQSEKLLVWETKTDRSSQLIAQLFEASLAVVNQIGKWEGERRPYPKVGMIRLSFLVSDGLYFGEGPFEVLQNDAMGKAVINAGIQLMTFLTQQVVK